MPKSTFSPTIKFNSDHHLTPEQAFAAFEHALEIANGCETNEELDEESDIIICRENCPDTFTAAQAALVQRIIEHRYLQSIGRA